MTTRRLRRLLLVLFVFVHSAADAQRLQFDQGRRSKCERITIPMCQDMPYNLTRMPNLMGHTDQSQAAIQVHEFVPLVEIGCSKHLKFFLCSLYAPMCTEQVDTPIPSCQSICEEVKSKCLPLLAQFNFNWPQALNCSRLPVPEKNGLCMEFPPGADERYSKYLLEKTEPSKLSPHSKLLNLPLPHAFPPFKKFQNGRFFDTFSTESSTGGRSSKNCPETMVDLPGRNVDRCIPRCGWDFLFTRNDKNFAEIWMGIWAAVCFMATIFTVSTFWINPTRFRYPERPIIFLSLCCCFSSIAYLFRIFAGSEFVSCNKSEGVESHLIVEGIDRWGCIVVFLLLYYFGMAAAFWWLVLTLSWYLAAGKQWGHEAIESLASYFHLMCWAVPGVLSIVVLALRHVDGDELTGLCFVGNQSRDALLSFVIAPLGFVLSLGGLLILLGFVSLLRIRRLMKEGGRNTSKLERLMVRIGLFSVLSTVPALTLLACLLYEYHQMPAWKARATANVVECLAKRGDSSAPCRLQDSIPLEEVFMLKILMSLLVGITTGVWIWSNKTWTAWGKLCASRFGRRASRSGSRVQYTKPPLPASLPSPQHHHQFHPLNTSSVGRTKSHSHRKALTHVTMV
ncbi:hypothetical protein HPB50_001255 [Hyalomma asiaticum]|uniref:Uncharacterized protein n=1 Tax=Hyalomma asiaticum TaxID=266040 RepID=A0ACB7S3C3_HYAAI|nr:hypothetical protein HPB50_001255 [Hyalomma asiaticum]